MMARFSTGELEDLVIKFPYFHQAHLLLAKKYQQENSPKFDQQLQLAALYTQDRELLFNIFSEAAPNDVRQQTRQRTTIPVVEEVTAVPEIPVVEEEKPEEIVLAIQEVEEPVVTETVKENAAETEEVEETPLQLSTSHTFDYWLKAFNKESVIVKQEPAAEEPTDEDLDNLIKQNVSVDFLHELVKEETQYSRGLDQFIEDQIQKHRQNEVKTPASESDLAAELITETMAKVYEMQKKYNKAIKAYEVLTLKFPEKSSLFAARINYLKNII